MVAAEANSASPNTTRTVAAMKIALTIPSTIAPAEATPDESHFAACSTHRLQYGNASTWRLGLAATRTSVSGAAPQHGHSNGTPNFLAETSTLTRMRRPYQRCVV